MRLYEFNETACSSAVRLRELDAHEATCMFRRLMCDLCDVVEDEEENRPGRPGGLGVGGLIAGVAGMGVGAAGSVMGAGGGAGGVGGGVCGFTSLLRDMVGGFSHFISLLSPFQRTVYNFTVYNFVFNPFHSVLCINFARYQTPHHRSTCGKRVTNCVFANFGCNWRGSFARLPAHRAACRKQPRTCPNGCGSHVSVRPMMMQHLELCPAGEVTWDAPDAEVGLYKL